MADEKKSPKEDLSELFERQAHGDVIEIDEHGRIVAPSAEPEREEVRSVVLHDPLGEYGAENFRMSKALVVLPDEAHLPRWVVEEAKRKASFPAFEFAGKDGCVTAVVGFLTPSGQRRYGIRVEVPEAYPYACPTVRTAGWSVGSNTPHTYSRTHLCILREAQWRSTYTIAFVLAKTALWLGKYEAWMETNVWPGNDQRH